MKHIPLCDSGIDLLVLTHRIKMKVNKPEEQEQYRNVSIHVSSAIVDLHCILFLLFFQWINILAVGLCRLYRTGSF